MNTPKHSVRRWTKFTSLLVAPYLLACTSDPNTTQPTTTGQQSPRPGSVIGIGTEPAPSASASSEPPSGSLQVGGEAALPLMTRGFVFSPNGARAWVAVPEEKSVKVVHLTASGVRTIDVSSFGTPARLFALGDFVYLTFRDASKLVQFAQDSPSSERSVSFPSSVEGLALQGESLYAACRDGSLVTLDSSSLAEVARWSLPDDLRDVVPLADGTFAVSRFRSAELLRVSSEGKVLQSIRPSLSGALRPAVAWKTLAFPDGNVVMLHLLSRGANDIGSYSGSLSGLAISVLSFSKTDAPAAAAQEQSLLDPFALHTIARAFPFGSGFSDMVMGEKGLLVVSPGRSIRMTKTIAPSDATAEPLGIAMSCYQLPDLVLSGEGCSTSRDTRALATHPLTGRVWILDERGSLIRSLDGSSSFTISAPRKNDAFDIFHIDQVGISCASCHPEGREDGLEWDFDGFAMRTQSLEGGLAVAPFHHRGDLPRLSDFMNVVFRDRFGGFTLNDQQLDATAQFFANIPAPPALVGVFSESGKSLFAKLDCANCHPGPLATDNALHDVGTGGEFVTPSLSRIGYRAPYLHDGAAKTLDEVFGLAGGGDSHTKSSQLSSEQRDALVQYLRSL